jgi:cell envelope-related function transcriptional attenuator common domain
MNTEIQRPKGSGSFYSFIRTFLLAFIIFVILCTPGMAIFGKVADWKFIGDNKVVLEEQLPTIVDKDSPFFKAFKDKNRVNILLLGINDNLTDTIMVASLDMDAKHVDLISIPRDTYYHREGHNSEGENKINAAYQGNPLNTAIAVSDVLLGMPINYYAIIDYKGIENIVDAMGGVPMDIKFDMKYKDPYDDPPLIINIPKGHQVLDGKHAVQFLRYRKGYLEGDLGRVKAHQEFMKSAFKQCISFDLPKIATKVFQNVESDITLGKATTIAKTAMGITADDIETYTLPGTPQTSAPWYVIPDAEKTSKMINQIYSIKPETTTDSSVEE